MTAPSARPPGHAPRCHLLALEMRTRSAALRMPFRFGSATIEALSILHVRVRLATNPGGACTGITASVLSPLWFDKSGRALEDKARDLVRAVRWAGDAVREAGGATVQDLHRAVSPAVRRRCEAAGSNALTASFGVAMVEAAMIDALCRASGLSFHDALYSDLLGLGPAFASMLPPEPRQRVAVRHTVGLADPLTAGDRDRAGDDGLPRTLAEFLEPGVRYFKIKVAGDVDAGRARLREIAGLLDRLLPDYRVTLDFNEQLADVEALLDLLRAIEGTPELAAFWQRTLWIEQPLARELSLDPARCAALTGPHASKPIILDEADDADDVVERALELGYRGISAKSCKGVLRTLHAHAVITRWNAGDRPPAVLAAEDLTNPPIVTLHQDLAVVAALGIDHVERNAHHYIRGLSFLPPAEQDAALRDYPSLYRRQSPDLVSLHIEGGEIDLRELTTAPFGVLEPPDWAALDPLEEPADDA